jgi:hypothetical protein
VHTFTPTLKCDSSANAVWAWVSFFYSCARQCVVPTHNMPRRAHQRWATPAMYHSNSAPSLPRSNKTDTGSCGNLQETRSVPLNSCRFHTGIKRNRQEVYTEIGSSFPAGINPYRKRWHPSHSSCSEKIGIAQYPAGSAWKKYRIQEETIGN